MGVHSLLNECKLLLKRFKASPISPEVFSKWFTTSSLSSSREYDLQWLSFSFSKGYSRLRHHQVLQGSDLRSSCGRFCSDKPLPLTEV